VRLAEMMSRAKLVPAHLQGSPGDCLMVVEQAMRWQMSPFAVAQCAASIKGKLMFEGKLIAAAVESSGAVEGFLDYQFSGEGAGRKIVVSGRRRGEAEPRTVEVALKDAKTDNRMWQIQPDQQLVYHGARVWARRWTPAVILGVYSPEEFSTAPAPVDTFVGPTIDATPEPTPSAAVSRVAAGVTDLIQRIGVTDRAGLEAITGDAAVVKQRAWLTKNEPDLAARIAEAVQAALDRIEATEDGPDGDLGQPEPDAAA
jgi:hypothetical protein